MIPKASSVKSLSSSWGIQSLVNPYNGVQAEPVCKTCDLQAAGTGKAAVHSYALGRTNQDKHLRGKTALVFYVVLLTSLSKTMTKKERKNCES